MTLTRNTTLATGASLALLLILTRGHHVASLEALPGASWAVFFLGGMVLRRALPFTVFIALAAGLDLASVTWGGTSNYCTSPAYPFLLPAYGCLWLAGRWFDDARAKHAQTRPLLLQRRDP